MVLSALIFKRAYLKSDGFVCSLENIYKELSTDIEDFTHPGHGDLTGWAKQGELMGTPVTRPLQVLKKPGWTKDPWLETVHL